MGSEHKEGRKRKGKEETGEENRKNEKEAPLRKRSKSI
jgi:hypothetical protein